MTYSCLYFVNNVQTLQLALKLKAIVEKERPDCNQLCVNLNSRLQDAGAKEKIVNVFVESGNINQILQNLRNIATIKACIDNGDVEVFVPNIDNIITNFVFYNRRVFRRNILVEGMLSYTDLSLRKGGRYIVAKKVLAQAYGLGYKVSDCHITGIDSAMANKIYALSTIGLEGFKDKVSVVDLYGNNRRQEFCLRPQIGLFVGQHYHERMLDGDYKPIADRVAKELSLLGLEKVIYKPHPLARKRDPLLELFPFYSVDATRSRSEDVIQRYQAGTCVSVNSTVLFNAKISYGPRIRCVSVGMSAFPIAFKNQEIGLRKVFERVGIECH